MELDNANIILLTSDTHYSITRMTARVTGVRLLEASSVTCQCSWKNLNFHLDLWRNEKLNTLIFFCKWKTLYFFAQICLSCVFELNSRNAGVTARWHACVVLPWLRVTILQFVSIHTHYTARAGDTFLFVCCSPTIFRRSTFAVLRKWELLLSIKITATRPHQDQLRLEWHETVFSRVRTLVRWLPRQTSYTATLYTLPSS